MRCSVHGHRATPYGHATLASRPGRRQPTRLNYRPPRPSLSTPFAGSGKYGVFADSGQGHSGHTGPGVKPVRHLGRSHDRLPAEKKITSGEKNASLDSTDLSDLNGISRSRAPSPRAGRRLESPAFQHAYPLVAIPGTLDLRACRLGDLRHERSKCIIAQHPPRSPCVASSGQANATPMVSSTGVTSPVIRHSQVASRTNGLRTPGRYTRTTSTPNPSSPRGPPRAARARISGTAA